MAAEPNVTTTPFTIFRSSKVFEERNAGALEQARKAGMTFIELRDGEKWVEQIRPVWAEFGKATPGAAELLKIIQG
jgi:TRAP-type C4-dicarboxylate transport system substrate-binding protein